MSFWFYLDSFPPSTNSSYLKVVPILSYGENPTIKYSSVNNTLYITVKQKTDETPVVDYIQEKEIEIKPETVEKWNSIQETINDAIEKNKNAEIYINNIFDFYKNSVNNFCNEIYDNIFNEELNNTIENYYN